MNNIGNNGKKNCHDFNQVLLHEQLFYAIVCCY